MKNNKAKFWFITWVISIFLGSVVSAVHTLMRSLEKGIVVQTPPFTGFQLIMLLGFVPICLIPLLGISCHYAVKENNRKIKIASICLIAHHILCVIAVLFQIL